jgi:hypothetical protein
MDEAESRGNQERKKKEAFMTALPGLNIYISHLNGVDHCSGIGMLHSFSF